MKETLNKLSRKLNIPQKEIMKVYKAYWKSIHKRIESLPLKDDLDEETFSKLKTNFNLPKLGKLHCIYEKYKVINYFYRNNNDKYKENRTDS
jgi:hypothetical protein